MRLEKTVHMVLNHTLDAALPPFRAVFSSYGLTEQQWRVLRVLWDHDEIQFAQLSDITLIPRPSLVGVLTRLEGKGLVSRHRSDTDRRNVAVSSTAKGHAIAQQAMPEINALHDRLGQALTQTEWDVLFQSLSKISNFAQSKLDPSQKTGGKS